MNTATQTAPATAPADRFRCESEVPDPPRDAAGRKQYWEDTVAEAVAELRRRLASTRDEKSFQALQMILDLEKTRLRHKEPVAGTQVDGGGRWADGLEPLPVYTESDREFALKKSEPEASATGEDLTPPAVASRDREGVASLTQAEMPTPLASRDREGVASLTQAEMPLPGGRGSPEPMPLPGGRGSPDNDTPLNTPSPERGGGRGVGSSASPPKPARPIPLRERLKLQALHKGVIGHFHDHDDDWMLERGRGRRNRDAGAEEPEIDLEAVRRSLPPPPPLPRVKNFELIPLRDEAPAAIQ